MREGKQSLQNGMSRSSHERAPMWRLTPRIVEVSLVVVILLAGLVDFYTLASSHGPWQAYAAPSILLLGVTIGYRFPWVGLALIAIVPFITLLSNVDAVAAWSMVCFAGFLLTLRGLPTLSVAPLLALSVFVSAGLSIGTIDVSIDPSPSIFAFAAAMGAVIGGSIRGNEQYHREVQLRIQQEQTARRAAVDRSIAQERLRIARDLHDSVGHQIAMVNMHLGAAEVSLPPDERTVRASLQSARESVKEVLKETQQILAILNVGRDEQQLEATPGHELITHLIESYRTGGLSIESHVESLGEDVDPQVSIAAYRIVQEALTNAHRYGDGIASITVKRDVQKNRVYMEIINGYGSRNRSSEPGGGNGLVGMRERAESVGGSLQIHSEPPLFRIVASLPLSGRK
ncbi:MAG: sensor histidine kinase [Bifidobacterium aquikefiri]|nr:sensor histidine kinase [Bifidobacterium aquikefiri]